MKFLGQKGFCYMGVVSRWVASQRFLQNKRQSQNRRAGMGCFVIGRVKIDVQFFLWVVQSWHEYSMTLK
jgi:hypothetical protein